MKSKTKSSKEEADEKPSVSKFCLDSASLCVFRYDSHGRIYYANPKAIQSLGYSSEELLNMSVFDIDPTLKDENWSDFWQSLCDFCSIMTEGTYIRKDRTVFPVEVNANLLEFGGEKLAVSFVRNITERKVMEESLLLTKFAFDKVPMGIFLIGSKSQILNVNEQACKTLGFTQEELCQKTLIEIDPNISKLLWSDIWEDLIEQKTISFETKLQRKDETFIPVEITSNLLEFNGDRQSIAFVRDIAEQKNTAKQIQEMEKHLRQAQRMATMGTLTDGIVHDFNNILLAILCYTQLTQLSCSDNVRAQRYLSQLNIAGTRAKNLVRQIHSFSRQGKSNKQPVDISKVINEALDLIETLRPSNIDVSKNVPSNLGSVMADETQIHQIIMNLCTNAFQAMGDIGGLLDIRLEHTNLSRLDSTNYSCLNPGQYLKLVISDTGEGIAPDLLPKIFDPYFTTKKSGEGTGLGLSIVYSIVKNHSGSIKIYSEPNVGTTIQIFLPLAEAR